MDRYSLTICSVVLLSLVVFALGIPSVFAVSGDQVSPKYLDCSSLDLDSDFIVTYKEYQDSLLSLSIKERTRVTAAMVKGELKELGDAEDKCRVASENPLVSTSGLYPYLISSLVACDEADLNRDGRVSKADLEQTVNFPDKSTLVSSALRDPLCI